MRARTFAALAALVVVDLAVVVVGYRAHQGTLPPMQRTAESFEVDQSPTPEPTALPAAGDVVGPVLLGINAEGVVLRATRGACEERFNKTAQLWTGDVDDGVALAAVQPPAIRELLGLMVYADGRLRVSGLDLADDGTCVSVTFDSEDGGATWQPIDDPGIWGLFGDITESKVIGPFGAIRDAPCPAAQIVNLPGQKAIASCDRSTYFRLPLEKSVSSRQAPDYSRLSVTAGPDGSYFVFGSTADCIASVGLATDQSVNKKECFTENKAPLAIASAEGVLVIQLGSDLMVSHDDGDSWEAVGEPSAAGETTAATS